MVVHNIHHEHLLRSIVRSDRLDRAPQGFGESRLEACGLAAASTRVLLPLARYSSACSTVGTGIERPRKRDSSIMRALRERRRASSSVSAQMAHTQTEVRGSANRGDELETIAIEGGERFATRVNKVGENIGKAALASPDGAVLRRPEQGRLHNGFLQVAEQLVQLIRKIVQRYATAVALQKVGDLAAAAGGAAETQVDSIRVETIQHQKRFGDFECTCSAAALFRRCQREFSLLPRRRVQSSHLVDWNKPAPRVP